LNNINKAFNNIIKMNSSSGNNYNYLFRYIIVGDMGKLVY